MLMRCSWDHTLRNIILNRGFDVITHCFKKSQRVPFKSPQTKSYEIRSTLFRLGPFQLNPSPTFWPCFLPLPSFSSLTELLSILWTFHGARCLCTVPSAWNAFLSFANKLLLILEDLIQFSVSVSLSVSSCGYTVWLQHTVHGPTIIFAHCLLGACYVTWLSAPPAMTTCYSYLMLKAQHNTCQKEQFSAYVINKWVPGYNCPSWYLACSTDVYCINQLSV